MQRAVTLLLQHPDLIRPVSLADLEELDLPGIPLLVSPDDIDGFAEAVSSVLR